MLLFSSQVVANNDSILNKAAIKVWRLQKDAEPLQLEKIVDTLTKEKTRKLHLDCSGCEPNDESCECIFTRLQIENTFNINLITADADSSTKWCPSSSVTSNFFKCNETYSIAGWMACNGFPDCPNGLDEAIMLCNVEAIVTLAPVLAVFFFAFGLAVILSIWGLEDEQETVGGSNHRITETLEDIKDFIMKPTSEKKKNLERNIQKMGLQDKVDLLQETYNIEIEGKDTKGQMMKTAVKGIFAVKSKEKSILLLVKNSAMPTAFKTRVFDLHKMGRMTRIKNFFLEKIPPEEMTYLTLVSNVCKNIVGILTSPSQDTKDLATIAVIWNFYYNVIQQRTEMIDNIDLYSVIILLIAIYISVQLLRMATASSTALPIRIPRCFPFGFRCNPRWVPIFTEIFIGIRRIQLSWKIFTTKLAIVQGIEKIKNEESSSWTDIKIQSSSLNRMYTEIEILDFKEKKMKISAVLGDIVQGAVLLVLLLRKDLRIRGALGLAKLAGQLGIETKSEDISGKKTCTRF